jgi:molybdopterin-guanine dinucleotide biosynthesis protein A
MFDAIVPAGGAARRLDGADKPGLLLGGRPLLDHVLAAVAAAERIVVVGPARPTAVPVLWRRESPTGGGPVAALATGVADLIAPRCVVLAADLPRIGPAVPVLLDALGEHDAAVLVLDGRRNFLAATWRTAALRDAIAELADPAGAAVRTLYDGRDVVDIEDADGWGRDCDTWADLEELR